MGADGDGFVELKNTGTAAIDLAGIALVYVDGADSEEYDREALTGTLAPGAFLVVAGDAQNGAPDGLALIDTDDGALLDALSYEGGITAAVVTGEDVQPRRGHGAAGDGGRLEHGGRLAQPDPGRDRHEQRRHGLGLHDDPDPRRRQRGHDALRKRAGRPGRRPPRPSQPAAARMRRATPVQLQSSTVAARAAARNAARSSPRRASWTWSRARRTSASPFGKLGSSRSPGG